jgi:hypothetical protein
MIPTAMIPIRGGFMDFSRLMSCGIIISWFVIGNDASEAANSDELTQNWDKRLSSTTRFTILADFDGQAVRDNETGLVWEKAPSGGPTGWAIARVVCLAKTTGGRKAWRLPSVHELASLIDATQPVPTLQPGHPFTVNLSSSYWTATLSADNPTAAWHVQPSNGLVSNIDRTTSFLVWCVRSEANTDTY